MVDGAVVQHIRSLLLTPEIAARAMEAARRNDPAMTENDVVNALAGFDALWYSMFPAEQAHIARVLIDRVTVTAECPYGALLAVGPGSVIREVVTPTSKY